MYPKDKSVSDERAVEASQLGRPAQADVSQANAGYYEPHRLADLTKQGRLYVIADGVSGAVSGQIVSQYAIKKVLHSFYAGDTPDPKTRLLDVVQQVNLDIYERNDLYPNRRPMVTTLTAALIHNNRLLVANVGDSQAYVVWGQDIERLDWETEPPPPAEPKDAPVLLLPSEAVSPAKRPPKADPNLSRQGVPQVLGIDKKLNVDTFTRRLFPADIVILCSGGLTGFIAEKEIARAVSRHSPEEAIPRLIALAAERGNRDPVAISITRVLSSAVALRPPTRMPLPTSPNWSDWDTLPKPSGPPATKPASPPSAKPAPRPDAPLPSPRMAETRPYYVTESGPRRWPVYLIFALVLAFLCALPILAWRYLIPPEMAAAVPFLGDIEILAPNRTESPIVDLSLEDTAEPDAAGQTGQTPEAQTEPTIVSAVMITPVATETLMAEDTPIAEATPEVTLVVENNSPIPTPETAFVSPVSAPTQTPPPAKPPTPVEPPTPVPTPLPTIELPADCENRARFMRDLTVPDGTQFSPGERFEKVWLLLNAQTCPWGPGYSVRFISGDPMGAGPELPLTEVVSPKTNGEINVPMIAPSSPGQYRGEWQLYDLTGEAFGPVMYLEIEVVPPDPAEIAAANQTTLYDFIENADKATWLSKDDTYTLLETDIDENLQLPPQGVVARGIGLLRGNVKSEKNVLLTYPHRALGFIEGRYTVDAPLQPTDALVAVLGFPKLSILSDDGVTFKVVFTPDDGSEQEILSKTVQYRDSPITEIVSLASIEPGQTGTFTLWVLGGESLNQDWAVWIDLRLVRPQ